MIRNLSEIILYVKDMEAQVQFYRDIMELPIEYPTGIDSYKDEYWVVFDTGLCKLALHGGGEGKIGKDSPKFVFDVEDVKAMREWLPRVKEVTLPKAGHNVHVDDRSGFLDALTKWL